MRAKDKDKVIAILCSDLHLSLNPPRARKDENWFEAMGLALAQLKMKADTYQVPIICAGDIFDKWNSPPELINFALEFLPEMYCIPGQHDLPLHNIADIKKSAYWTLVKAGRIHDITEGAFPKGIMLHGFSWEEPVTPLKNKMEGYFNLAVVHEYVSMRNHDFPGAPKESRVRAFTKKLKGYDAAVFGDNHKGFLAKAGDVFVFNCGGFMRRASDQEHYFPQIGLLYSSGYVQSHKLDISKDILEVTETAEQKDDMELQEFLEELKDLENNTLDFKEAIKELIIKKKPKKKVKDILLEAMGC